jgi:diguanylate cyclase (GGDEF)-like protein
MPGTNVADKNQPSGRLPEPSAKSFMYYPSESRSARTEAPLLALPEGIQKAASFGIWTYDAHAQELRLSATAADLLAVEPGSYGDFEHCLVNVAQEDRPMLAAILRRRHHARGDAGFSFRVSTKVHGLRWLRLSVLAESGSDLGFSSGFFADVTPIKAAEMRERFIFRFTQLLIGTHTIEEVIGKILPLVCINLGWEWGAYWTPDAKYPDTLVCQQFWHEKDSDLVPFSVVSLATAIPVGRGLIGRVWSSMQPRWIEDMPGDAHFLRSKGAQDAGLQSGYCFPVVHASVDGGEQRFGVLEFFSKQPRQPSAQLPLVSAAVGALVGQTVQRLEQEAIIRSMAQTDEMTGLANRSYFQQQVRNACQDAAECGKTFGLLYIDLDRFKPINDAFGHEAGNVLLKEFSARLARLVPQGSVAGRLGGDEFCVLLHAEDFATSAKRLSNDVLRVAREPVMFNGYPLVVSASIGVAAYPDDGATIVDLLRNADAAMYRSKHGGRNCVSFSDGKPEQLPAMGESFLAQRMAIDAELQQALQRDAFFLVYQPIVEAASGRMVALEALVRWRKESGEVMYPNQFIHIAEERGMISDIDRWVTERACADLAAIHRNGARDMRISVNMTAPEFARATLPQELLELTQRYGIAPEHLCLELTERMMMKQPDQTIAVMRELRSHGFAIGLDDFGTEHSSLSRLKNLPITSLKIDRSFIHGLPDDVHDRAIVRAIMELGREMALDVVIEGVENPLQLQILRELGDPLVQGYLTGRPCPLVEIIAAIS